MKVLVLSLFLAAAQAQFLNFNNTTAQPSLSNGTAEGVSICSHPYYQLRDGQEILVNSGGGYRYTNNLNCSMTLSATSQTFVVTFEPLEFDLEGTPYCNYDYLKIGFTKFCGNWSPNASLEYIVFPHSTFEIDFHTDASVVKPGFLARFTVRNYVDGTPINIYNGQGSQFTNKFMSYECINCVYDGIYDQPFGVDDHTTNYPYYWNTTPYHHWNYDYTTYHPWNYGTTPHYPWNHHTTPYHHWNYHTTPNYHWNYHTTPNYHWNYHTTPNYHWNYHTTPYYHWNHHTTPYYPWNHHTTPYYPWNHHTTPYYPWNYHTTTYNPWNHHHYWTTTYNPYNDVQWADPDNSTYYGPRSSLCQTQEKIRQAMTTLREAQLLLDHV